MYKFYKMYRDWIRKFIFESFLLKGSFIARFGFCISLAFLFFVDDKTTLMAISAILLFVASGATIESVRKHKVVYLLILSCFSLILILESFAYFFPEHASLAKISTGTIILVWKFAVLFTGAAIFELLIPPDEFRYLFIRSPKPRLAVVSAAASIPIGKRSVLRARRAMLAKGIRFRNKPYLFCLQFLGMIAESWNDFHESFQLSVQSKGIGEKNFSPMSENIIPSVTDIPFVVMLILCILLAIIL
jgi:hypothetical protein